LHSINREGYNLLAQTKYTKGHPMSSENDDERPFSDEEGAVWRGLLHIYRRVVRALDQELARQHRLPVREFDVLMTLFRAPDRHLRMSELAERVLLSPSGLTRMVERLERECLVQRQSDPLDARSFHAVLTDVGAQRLAAARATHNAIIRALFIDRLSPQELCELGAIWRNVLLAHASTPDEAETQPL
jgi:DNA-binding MarR family transcriptional regulator